jgi:cobalt-zinc-cadmium efflux system protein
MESDHPNTASRRLFLSLGITLVLFLGEVIGGLLSNSLALLSDAGHVLTDALALGLSLVAAHIMRKPSDNRATYGYHRVGLIAAVINGVSLLLIAVFIFWEAIHRFYAPEPVATGLMLGVATAGLIGNLLMAWILGHSHTDLNMKSAWLHVLGDALSSVGVIIAGLVMQFTGWTAADPLASVIVGIIIMVGGYRVIRESLQVFLEFSPAGIHSENIALEIRTLSGIVDVHDVHLWSISHGVPSFSAHIQVSETDMEHVDTLRSDIETLLAKHGIHHVTLQMTNTCCADANNGIFCSPPSRPGDHDHAH